ncbi:MAG TPA: MFS transporter [Acidimicrobiia bacterium]|nr:MFS transporter [Acidimicrobiia bacterium]
MPPAILRPFLPRVPLTRDDRWIIFLLWVTGVAMGWAQGEASALLPFTRRDLGVTEGGMSLILALARLGAFGAILLGGAADRIGRRRPLIAALGLLLVGNGLSAIAPTPTVYGLAQGLARIGGASVAALGVVVLAEGVSNAVRAYAISFFGAAASLGAGFSVLTLPLADSTEWSWRLPHALPLVLIPVLPLLWRHLPESPLIMSAHVRLPWGDLLRGERRRRFLLVSVAGLLASAFSAVGLAFTTERLIGELGHGAGIVILVSIGGGTVGALGFFAGGRLADGWGRRPTSILALSLALAGGLALFAVSEIWALWLASLVAAFGTFAYIPAGGAHRAELFPTSLRGASNTSSNYLATVGSALGLLLGSLTIDHIGLLGTMTVLGVGVVVAAVLTAALPETMGHDLHEL